MITTRHITVEQGGVRLDAALLSVFPSSTRAFVREAIESGAVLVDGRKGTKGEKLRGGETIEVTALAEAADNVVAPDPSVHVHEIFADNALLAYDKKAGIPVQPLSHTELGTLMNGVVARHPECAALGDRPLMAGAVHRIDADTSGLVLVARTAEAFDALRAQFAAQSVRKTYLALVEGTIATGGTLENDLIHDPTLPYCRMLDARRNRLTRAQCAKLKPLHAVTNFKPISFTTTGGEERTLLEIEIFTGVTHQIRAQLALAGIHIINDRLYGAFAIENQTGHYLHALSAAFRHPVSDEPTKIQTPLPRWAAKAIFKCLLAVCLFGVASSATAANMLSDGGFEKWNDAKNQPAGASWRWGFSQKGTNGFAICECSTSERHGGHSSLHLKDTNSGPLNHSMWYLFGADELKAMAGKEIYASAWIKQVSASNPRQTGLALYATGEDGKTVEHHNGPGTQDATDWMNVHVKIKMPEKVKSARLRFDCAHGFGNTGEMYVDDVIVSDDPSDHPAPTLRLPADDSLHSFEIPEPNDSPEEAAYRRSWREEPPKDEDGLARPEIKNGTWYSSGTPEFYLGVWLYNSDMQWGPKCNPLGIDHPAYREPPGKELFAEMGFNSSQISSAHSGVGAAVRGLPLTHKKHKWEKDWTDEAADIARFFGRFGDMPMVLDFAFGYDKRYSKAEQSLLAQRKAGTTWHAFIPFCPHSPEGGRYYRDYFLGGTRAAMRNGCNVFLYELFNESAWNDMCRYNIVRFAQAMEDKYRDIAAANAAWAANFDSFRDLACQSDLKQFQGLWYDWCRFSAKSYCELLRKGIETIKSVDRRSRVYFTEQESGTPTIHRGQDGRDIAATLDVLAIEGGWQYGFKTDFNARDEMEAVVATARSRHFFNCDFYQALAKGVKPVVNNEHYCTRFENGKRVPSHRADYMTSMWLEVMHGVSASFVYVWDKRYWEAKTPEQALANVVNPSYKSSSLLNPYNVKPEDLCAFKMFREELAPYKDKILPFPRTKPATVAVYYSKASEIHRDALPGRKGRPSVSDWYATLLHSNFPCKVVFDDDIAALGPEVEALVVPLAQSNPSSVAAGARAFQSRGGIVVADEEAFRYDEYMKPAPAEASFIRVKEPREAVTKLLAAGVRRYAVLEADDGKGPISGTDAQVVDRGDFKLVCLAAMQERETRHAKLRLLNLAPVSGELHLWNVAERRPLPNGEKETWTTAELERGLPLKLPPQERVVIALTTTRHGRE